MDKLKINLIPPEIREKAKKESKRSFINKISIVLLGVLISITAGILVVIIFQSVTVRRLNTDITQEESKVDGLKDKEAVVYFLKNRIDLITKFSNTQFTQSDLFDLIAGLFPEDVSLITLQIDKGNTVVVQGETTSTASLDNFFSNLTDPKSNEGKIKSVSVESLNKNQLGMIRFSLNLTLGK